jgi:hypothetical protein
MSALPPKADISWQRWNVRFVPKADIAVLPINVRYASESGRPPATNMSVSCHSGNLPEVT